MNQKSPFRQLPLLEDDTLVISNGDAGMKFVANCLGELYGGNPMEKARIDNWLDNSTQVLRPNLNNWLDFVFGKKPTCDEAMKQA
mmetsp:Transcript_12995/g.1989  ORF Transcript_12995/g.1989 Transcript_12995/m.1989 type:complete len:85 (-) Transcript_12995:856-1110(-)